MVNDHLSILHLRGDTHMIRLARSGQRKLLHQRTPSTQDTNDTIDRTWTIFQLDDQRVCTL
jgi:hypothetical protein